MTISAINGTITHTVVLGSSSYASTLSVAGAGLISATAAGSVGVYASGPSPSLYNAGTIKGAIGAEAGFGVNGSIPSGPGGDGVAFTSAGYVGNSGYIAGGTGGLGNYEVHGSNGGNGVALYDGGNLNNSGRIVGGMGGSARNSYGGNGGSGVYLSATSFNIVLNTGVIAGGAGGFYIYGQNVQTAGTGGIGLRAMGGNLIINGSSGTIKGGTGGRYGGSGGIGVTLKDQSEIKNYGTIIGGNNGYVAPGGVVSFGGAGLSSDNQDTIKNYGSILGGSGGGAYGGGAGATLSKDDALTNSGLIAGGYGGGIGLIIDSLDVADIVSNSGRLEGGNGNIYDPAGGSGVSMSNISLYNSGTITGGNGLQAGDAGGAGVTLLNAGTLINAGTISGGEGGAAYGSKPAGQPGDAVQFGLDPATLIVDPGAVFNGLVAANYSSADVLEFAGTTPGTLTGLGTEFTGFQQVSIDAGAHWTETGNDDSTGIGTVLSIAGTLVEDGFLNASGPISITSSGSLQVGDGAIVVAQSLTLAGGTLGCAAGGAINIGANADGYRPAVVTVQPDTVFDAYGMITNAVTDYGTLFVPGHPLTLLGALAVPQTGSIVISAAISTSATLDLRGGGTIAGDISGGGMLKLDGTAPCELSGGMLLTTEVTVDAHAVLDGRGVVLSAIANAGDIEALGGTLTLAGGIGGGGELSAAAGATLLLTGGGIVSGTVAGGGTVQLGGGTSTLGTGAALTVSLLLLTGSGTVLTLGISVSDTGGFTMNAGTIAAAGHLLSLTGAASFTGGTIAGKGYLATHGTVKLSALTLASGAIWQDYGLLDATGRLTVVAGNRLTVETDGVVDLTGSGGIAGTGQLFNGGLVERTGAAGTSIISAVVSGTETIAAAAGSTLDFTGGGSFAGTIEGAGTIAFGGGKGTIAAATTITSAIAISGTATALTLAENLTFARLSLGGGSTLALGGETLKLTGAATLSGMVRGSGTLSTMGAVVLGSAALAGGALWTDTGTITHATGTLTLGAASGDTGRLDLLKGSVLDLTGNAGIATVAGASGIIDNGTLIEKTGGTGTSLIGATLFNLGTLAVTSGTLEVAGAVSYTGHSTIGKSGTLKFDGAVGIGQTISFAGTTGGELALNDPSGGGLGFAGKIAGFSGSDKLDLLTFAFAGKPAILWNQTSSSSGTLTVTDGKDIAKITLFGQYVQSGFGKAKDAGTGTAITYTPPPQMPALALPRH